MPQYSENILTTALSHLFEANQLAAQQIYQAAGTATILYENRKDLRQLLPELSERLLDRLALWPDAIERTMQEMEWAEKHSIRVIDYNHPDYPQRLRQCCDAPLAIFLKGNANLNQRRIVSIVGTRHATNYGLDLTNKLVADLKEQLPHLLIVSGLAYGIDIFAHRAALNNATDTVGVVAHGLDQIYPTAHRETAIEMISHGGLLTEYFSQTKIDKRNFVQRNRIVAGISDATIIVESAVKGGGLITCQIANDYNRSVFAFPGSVNQKFSQGCNNLIRSNGATLITSADDLIRDLGWQEDRKIKKAAQRGIERQLFPTLSDDEKIVTDFLAQTNDQRVNTISVKTNIDMNKTISIIFKLEMKGIVKTLAGGNIHLINN